jgi:GxxExxY protein
MIESVTRPGGLLEQELTNEVLRAAIEVHRQLGPGLLESVYEQCLCRELQLREIPFQCQVSCPVVYKGEQIEAIYRLDLLVDKKVIVEVKAVEELLRVHEAQLLSYLRLTGKRVGLLINFNVPVLKEGIRRRIL